ncbi:hypothetical protein JTE90_017214 [Oedothorax gibbosus]|uniref:BTB domain-containing protein n=1 Tax=Oedothorax gibbosus TaxID=931172 RepID=A0AAV6VDK8_9ARAC|nr:hypothetical protein JTE90_017214 [Oedothorax gibbosus]
MEKPDQVCKGFNFPANSHRDSTVSLRIQNHDWLVQRSSISSNRNGYTRTNGEPLLLKFQRPESSENVLCHLIIFLSNDVYTCQRVDKRFFFPKGEKMIEVGFLECNYTYSSFSLFGVVSVSFPDSCKTDDKKSNVGSTSSSDVISSQLSKDFAHLLDSDVSSDYVLRCAGEEFHVHKCILAARSSVFAAMFRFYAEAEETMTQVETMSDVTQKKAKDCTKETSTASNQAEDIVDMKPEILKKMLKYIYSGQIDELTSTEAGDLLYAADKYQLDLLKKICVNKLKSTLSASNVLDILVIGDLHDESLKAHAMNFICEYPSLSELKKMDQWKSLQTINPAMVIEVLTSVVGYLQDSKK